MAKLARWQPFATDLDRWFDEVDRAFDRMLARFFRDLRWDWDRGRQWLPPMEVAETADAYIVRLEVPGVRPEDIEVTLQDGVLTVRGKRERHDEQKGETYHLVERAYGEFVRSLELPGTVKEDAIEATYKDGILELRLPKSEESKPRRIAVKAA
ncbi:Spore protein SP21 [bacterium HR17]|jgi:HSP20 family protein|uniref:Spore protein SP21 n=1 Tax=Candidatus Fervidibacter japonicus TaxID=2035412 RepID=A0A2H5XFB7_9BACT|nr:Spore protein SP21 [bacterium HR17]